MLRDQRADGRRLGEILVERALVTNEQLTQVLSHQLALPWVSLAKVHIEPELLALIPRELATRHHIVPVYLRRVKDRSTLFVATDDPTDDVALAECAVAARVEVRAMVASTDDLMAAIDVWYGGSTRPARASVAPDQLAAGAMRVAVSVFPSPGAERPAPPMIPKPAQLPPRAAIDEVELHDDDVVAHVSDPPAPALRSVVLVVAAPTAFVRNCRIAADAIDARVEKSDLAGAAARARELSPIAIVVTEDVYAFDRLGLTKLAVETDALLVIWSDELEAEYLEPLLETAQHRRAPRK